LLLTPEELTALWLSLKIGLWCTALIAIPGIITGWLLARDPVFLGKAVVDGLVHLPLVLPPVVIGYLLLISLGTRAPLGAWLKDTFGIQLIFTMQGVVVAAAVMAFPLMVRAIRLSLDGVEPRHRAGRSHPGRQPARRAAARSRCR
jgi:molybdate transport system permease protein